MADAEHAGGEVDVLLPAQTEELTLPEPGGYHHDEQGTVSVVVDGLDTGAGLSDGERLYGLVDDVGNPCARPRSGSRGPT